MYLNRVFLHVPFRMKLGLLGIWLMKIGRILQVRYANWNNEFRLRTDLATDFCTIHTTTVNTSYPEISFSSPGAQMAKQNTLIRALFEIPGVRRVNVYPYTFVIDKGGVYEWSELIPRIEAVMIKHLPMMTEIK